MFREILYSKFQASGEAKAAKNLRAAGEVNNPTDFDFHAYEETNLHENEHFDPLDELILIVLCFAGNQDFVCFASQIYAGEVNKYI